jgi:hypothetical protein
MTIKTLRLGVLTFLATVSVLVANGGTAFAHYMYQTGILYYSNADCVGGYAEISHGIGYGYTKAYVDATVIAGGGTPCTDSFTRPPAVTSASFLTPAIRPGLRWSGPITVFAAIITTIHSPNYICLMVLGRAASFGLTLTTSGGAIIFKLWTDITDI